MNILINGNKIDFKLENETSLCEVVESIKDWARKDNYFIYKIKYDEKPYNSNDVTCKNVPLSSISEVNFDIKSRIELHQENLQLLYQYVSLFEKAIESSSNHLIEDLQKDAKEISQLLAEFLQEDYNNDETFSRMFFQSICDYEVVKEAENEEYKTTLKNQLSALYVLLKERIMELSNPLGELNKTIASLRETEKDLTDISILLQTGKEKEAWNSITKFSELNQKLLRLYPLLLNSGIEVDNVRIEELSFSEYYTELNNILNELIEAFTSNDSVLIGDLIEYEVAPRLSVLIEFLEKIIKDGIA